MTPYSVVVPFITVLKSEYNQYIDPHREEWYEYNPDNATHFTITSDYNIDLNKTYYKLVVDTDVFVLHDGVYERIPFSQIGNVNLGVTYYIQENPSDNDWYEIDGGSYVKSSDDAPESGKTYYKLKYVFKNAHTREYFETMYFNHFIKVYPIDAVQDGNTYKTNKLYCENFDLVSFKDIVPYVVSYKRKGVDNLDNSIFSRIVSYNKHTHLITVDSNVYFKNTSGAEYVVVAYQNTSPFNKINKLSVVAPTDKIKNIVKPVLSDFSNQNCTFEIKTANDTEWEQVI